MASAPPAAAAIVITLDDAALAALAPPAGPNEGAGVGEIASVTTPSTVN